RRRAPRSGRRTAGQGPRGGRGPHDRARGGTPRRRRTAGRPLGTVHRPSLPRTGRRRHPHRRAAHGQTRRPVRKLLGGPGPHGRAHPRRPTPGPGPPDRRRPAQGRSHRRTRPDRPHPPPPPPHGRTSARTPGRTPPHGGNGRRPVRGVRPRLLHQHLATGPARPLGRRSGPAHRSTAGTPRTRRGAGHARRHALPQHPGRPARTPRHRPFAVRPPGPGEPEHTHRRSARNRRNHPMSRRSDRFQPSRAGVVNVWDYVDEEFAFADGRLVLRGHNGSGKTKALEVLFPFVLDGYTDARRLDPCCGQNRTMKASLLYRGQDYEYGYVWMEFARATPTPNTPPEIVTLVIGLRAHKHRDGVIPSFFVTDLRMGVDFGLLAADQRPLTERQLKAALGQEAHHDTATDYRRAVDSRLFGLGDRYTQLLDLLLALRRPLLAKDLDPEKVSNTLTSGLSPVDDTLLDQAARDFANLAAVRRRFDSATEAHEAVRVFIERYADYLTTNARHRLSRVTAAPHSATEHAHTATPHDRAVQARTRARTQVDTHNTELRNTTAQIKALENDEALRDHTQLNQRRTHAQEEGRRLAAQASRIDDRAQEVARLRTEADRVAQRLEHDRATAQRLSIELVEAAERAGITHDAEGPVDTGEDLPTTAPARAAARQDDLRAVTEQLQALDTAENDRTRAEADSAHAEAERDEHERAGTQAQEELTTLRTEAAEAVHTWAARWDLVDDTCRTALLETVDRFGEPGAPTLTEVFNEHAHHAQLHLAARVQQARAAVDETTRERDRLQREHDDIAAERDDAPSVDPLRTAPRDGRRGAPLWQLVRFADGLTKEHAAALEGALHAAGLLTAWVHPDPDLTRAALEETDGDAYLLAEPNPHPGPTLADVLVPEEQEHVPTKTITALLRSVPHHTNTDAVTT